MFILGRVNLCACVEAKRQKSDAATLGVTRDRYAATFFAAERSVNAPRASLCLLVTLASKEFK